MPTVVRAQLWDIRHRIAELELTLEPLQKAAQIALRERGFCTENDPPFIPGTEAWRYAVRTLREELPLIGDWHSCNHGNYSLVVNDKVGVNIVVATGDAATGIDPGSPRTKSIKGLYTQAAIERNNRMDDLFPDTLPEEIVQKARSLEYPTWVYLIYTTDTEVRVELSYPDNYENGEITSWKERIFVPTTEIDPSKLSDGKDDQGPDFNIDIRLK